jgi:hypothetical protein
MDAGWLSQGFQPPLQTITMDDSVGKVSLQHKE